MTLEKIIGIILLVINMPFGWFFFAYYIFRARETGKKFYYGMALGAYLFSWILLLVGIYLCGKEYSDIILQNIFVKYSIPFVVIMLVGYVVYKFNKIIKKK